MEIFAKKQVKPKIRSVFSQEVPPQMFEQILNAPLGYSYQSQYIMKVKGNSRYYLAKSAQKLKLLGSSECHQRHIILQRIFFVCLKKRVNIRQEEEKPLSLVTVRSCRSHMFFKIGVLKNFAIFTGKHLCWSLSLIELQVRPELY